AQRQRSRAFRRERWRVVMSRRSDPTRRVGAMVAVGAAILAVPLGAQTPKSIAVESPTLKADQPIPRDYTADGRNVSPPLAWKGVPATAKQLAVVLEDPDAGNPPPFVHWVIYK